MLEQFMEDCLPCSCWSRGRVRGVLSLRRKEWQRERDELTVTPIPHPSVPLREGR